MFHIKKKRLCYGLSISLAKKFQKNNYTRFLKESLQIVFNVKHVPKKGSAFNTNVPHCQMPFFSTTYSLKQLNMEDRMEPFWIFVI